MPGPVPDRAVIPLQVRLSGLRSNCRRIARIKADNDNIKVATKVEASDAIECSHQAVQLLVTQHGATIVNKRQNHRLRGEILVQADSRSIFINKHQVQRDLLIQPLVNAYPPEDRDLLVRTSPARLGVRRALRTQRKTDRSNRCDAHQL